MLLLSTSNMVDIDVKFEVEKERNTGTSYTTVRWTNGYRPSIFLLLSSSSIIQVKSDGFLLDSEMANSNPRGIASDGSGSSV